jgi:polysaccharide deacetylase family protein (PEP-CTERM system associated)
MEKKKHTISIDIEDWYQGIELSNSSWFKYEKRIEYSVNLLIELLDYYNTNSTCFILGKVAEENPKLVETISKAGHEIATHGYSHEKIYNQNPVIFREELKKSINILQDITGKKVIGHRAAYFSITKESFWALDILAEEGILYDSSIQPVINYRYGIHGSNRLPSTICTSEGSTIFEIPVSSFPMGKFNLPLGGGAYLRIFPISIFKKLFKIMEKRDENLCLYLHPWELDNNHPKINLPFRISLTHYFNLNSTIKKLSILLNDFKFYPIKEVFQDEIYQIELRRKSYKL